MMANPFDKFDSQGGNEFDKFDAPAEEPSVMEHVKQGAVNLGAGAIRGAGSIGATLWWPADKARDLINGDRKGKPSRNEERRTQLDKALAHSFGADLDSVMFKAGKLGGEVASTAGVGGVLANGARAIGAAPALVSALSSGGMRAGGLTGAQGMAVRTAGGAVTGGVSAGLIDPQSAGLGAVFGGALPGAAKLSGMAGAATADAVSATARRLMHSSLKPTIGQLKRGEAETAVDVLLKYGANPTKAGVRKLRGVVDDLNSQIESGIAGSNAQIDKQAVIGRLAEVRKKFGNQVSPTSDLKAIEATADDFVNHPNLPGSTIPVASAQALKQGTYKVLSKKYGQVGAADVEAQKALARGLKEEIADAVPGIGALNAEESKLIAALNVTERRALMELNKNPGGLSLLAGNPLTWAAFMADRSAAFKSITARLLNSSAAATQRAGPRLESALSNPLLRTAIPVSTSRQ